MSRPKHINKQGRDLVETLKKEFCGNVFVA